MAEMDVKAWLSSDVIVACHLLSHSLLAGVAASLNSLCSSVSVLFLIGTTPFLSSVFLPSPYYKILLIQSIRALNHI